MSIRLYFDEDSMHRSLVRALATVEAIEQVALRSEGPVVSGRAYVTAGMFLEFYFNSQPITTRRFGRRESSIPWIEAQVKAQRARECGE